MPFQERRKQSDEYSIIWLRLVARALAQELLQTRQTRADLAASYGVAPMACRNVQFLPWWLLPLGDKRPAHIRKMAPLKQFVRFYDTNVNATFERIRLAKIRSIAPDSA